MIAQSIIPDAKQFHYSFELIEETKQNKANEKKMMI